MLTRRALVVAFAAAPLALSLTQPARAAEPEIFAAGGVAINGYDPVAYFTDAAPVRGDAAHALQWNGATWHFASAENQAKFEADPTAYAPQYGGYCAYAASKGGLATTDPAAWTIVDDKLYLNFSRDVKTIWSEDIPGNITKADANWPGILER